MKVRAKNPVGQKASGLPRPAGKRHLLVYAGTESMEGWGIVQSGSKIKPEGEASQKIP
jgi:hypothetical protein